MSHHCDESYDVYDETLRKANKRHTCGACGEAIELGDYYHSVHLVFDGSAETVKRCARCQAIHAHLRTKGRGDSMWPDERLNCGEEYEAHWGEKPPDEVAALAFATREEMQAKWPHANVRAQRKHGTRRG